MLAIRGTASLSDVLTDMLGASTAFGAVAAADGAGPAEAHAGFVHAARGVLAGLSGSIEEHVFKGGTFPVPVSTPGPIFGFRGFGAPCTLPRLISYLSSLLFFTFSSSFFGGGGRHSLVIVVAVVGFDGHNHRQGATFARAVSSLFSFSLPYSLPRLPTFPSTFQSTPANTHTRPADMVSARSGRPLIVTGHSLGAGTAAATTVELLQQYPDRFDINTPHAPLGGQTPLSCFAYACPPVFSKAVTAVSPPLHPGVAHFFFLLFS